MRVEPYPARLRRSACACRQFAVYTVHAHTFERIFAGVQRDRPHVLLYMQNVCRTSGLAELSNGIIIVSHNPLGTVRSQLQEAA